MPPVTDPSPVLAAPIGDVLIQCAKRCIAASAPGDSAAIPLLPDLDRLVAAARDHGVLPLLHRAARSGFPAQRRDQLDTQVRRNAARNLVLMRALVQLFAAMQAQGVRLLAYKGPLLAMFGYGDLSLRQSGDLDLLVPRRDLHIAQRVLEQLGYRPTRDMTDDERREYEASPHEYDFVYVSSDRRVMVELHWQVAGDLFDFSPDPEQLWARAQPTMVAGTPIRQLADEDLLLILCAHGLKHFWTRLGWICDVAMLIQRRPELDWAVLLRRADELRARGMTLLGLALAQRVLATTLPENVILQISPSIHRQAEALAGQLFQVPNHRDQPRGAVAQLAGGGLFRSLMFHASARERWSSRFRYVFHRAFTPNVVDNTWVKLPTVLRPLYYFARPLRLVSKYGLRRR